jgi:hypothetical protein
MTLGADPKKVAILGVLLVIGAVVLYSNLSSDAPAPRPVVTSQTAPPPVAQSEAPPALPASGAPDTRRRAASSGSVAEFKPRQGTVRPEDRPDPATVDPTLRFDLLAKVQAVELPVTSRNIFQFGAAPPPPKPIELPKNVPKIPINQPPATAPPIPTGPPPPPPAPPITFKYYGYKVSKATGVKEAFLLDGDDIIIATENEQVKRGRYRVVKINVNSITIEDTQFKHTQTLPLEEQPAAA